MSTSRRGRRIRAEGPTQEFLDTPEHEHANKQEKDGIEAEGPTPKIELLHISKAERDLLMKQDYVIDGMDIEELMDKYDLSQGTVEAIIRRGKWKKIRKEFISSIDEAVKSGTAEVYIKAGTDVTLLVHSTWLKMVSEVNQVLNDRDKQLYTREGTYKTGTLKNLSEVLAKAQEGLKLTTGVVDRETAKKDAIEQATLKIKTEELELKRRLAGEDTEDEVVPEDNFLEALGILTDQVWGEEDKPKEVEQQ